MTSGVRADGRSEPPGPAANRLPLLTVAVLGLLNAIAPFATDAYLPGFPRMADELNTDAANVQLTLTAFMAGLAIGQLVIGPLSDRLGRRRPLVIGAAVCVVATVLCALAPTVGTLIIVRFVQGFSGAAGLVIGRAIVADTLRGPAAARIFSVLLTISSVAPVVAPLVGGAVLGVVGWRGVFWLLGGVTALMLAGSVFVLRETLPPERRQAGGFAATGRAARVVVTNRRYLGYTLTFVLAFGAMFSYISASPFVLQNAFGLSEHWFSLAFAVNAIGLTLSSVLNARLVSRAAPRRILTIGLFCYVLCCVLLGLLALTGSLTRIGVLLLLFLAMTSIGLVMANATALAIAEAPQSAGTASAVIGAGQFALAAIVSPLVGLGGEDTAVPMAVSMALFSLASMSAFLLLTSRSGTTAPQAAGEAAGTP
jgi:DHA1 family bicyclomycin/chloramphenicol resistance-like MFS transporter